MKIELNMLHISMSIGIISKFNSSLIITINNSRGLNRKSKLIEKLSDPNCLWYFIDNTTVLDICSQKRDYILFLTQAYHRSSFKLKHIAISVFPFSNVTFLVRISKTIWWIWMVTTFVTKLISTLNVSNNSLCKFPVAFLRISHEPRNHINKEKFRPVVN